MAARAHHHPTPPARPLLAHPSPFAPNPSELTPVLPCELLQAALDSSKVVLDGRLPNIYEEAPPTPVVVPGAPIGGGGVVGGPDYSAGSLTKVGGLHAGAGGIWEPCWHMHGQSLQARTSSNRLCPPKLKHPPRAIPASPRRPAGAGGAGHEAAG